MKLGAGILFLVVALAETGLSCRSTPALSGQLAEASPPRAGGARTPVLVELFTSEGCSSCPPADALLAQLHQTQPVPGAEVIAVEQHVDYWNHLGWRDPFSSAELTERQREYARAFGNDTVYTPQMVVDGQTEFVGSSEGRARMAIARAARTPKTLVLLSLAPNSSAANGATIALSLRVEQLENATPGDTPEVFLAITESGLHSDVQRGENAGLALDHVGVVRELKRLGAAKLGVPGAFEAQPGVALAAGWKRENLRAVVFVQEARSRRVLAAASIPLAQK